MIRIEKLEQWHIDRITPRGTVYHGEEGLKERLSSYIGDADSLTAAFVDGDTVLAIVGANFIWNGVAHLWAITTDYVPKMKIRFHKEVKNILNQALTSGRAHRLQATVKVQYEEGQNWLIALGFEQEGILKNYGPDKQDYIMFARVN